MMINALEQRIEDKRKLTIAEIALLKILIKRHMPGFSLVKKDFSPPKFVLGEQTREMPMNPFAQYYYKDDKLAIMSKALQENPNWCGQFAGIKQWQKVGRSIDTEKQQPIYTTNIYGKEICLYAFEQTTSVM